jgi:PTS system nitrogen regulatory IIA component
MNLDTLISSDAVFISNDIKSKKRALEILAEKLAEMLASETSKPGHTSGSIADAHSEEVADEAIGEKEDYSLEIFQLLIEREKLGSTSMGHGVALPHTRTNLTEHATGAFLKLDNGINFDSPDDQKTDLIFALMVPEHYTDEHLKILSHLATLFSDKNFCQQLRDAKSSDVIYKQLIDWQPISEAS